MTIKSLNGIVKMHPNALSYENAGTWTFSVSRPLVQSLKVSR